MKVVGKNVTKIDAFKLARGEPVFTDDFTRGGMLYAKVLRSPHAHARILKVDTSKALAMEGVVDVIWHQDVKAIPHTRAGQSYPEPSPYDTVITAAQGAVHRRPGGRGRGRNPGPGRGGPGSHRRRVRRA